MQWKLNADGDIDLTGGVFVTVAGAEETAQRCKIRLRWGSGEWFLSRVSGIPYIRSLVDILARPAGDSEISLVRIIGKNPNLNHVRAIFRRAIESTPGVGVVRSVDAVLDKATRRLLVSWSATTDAGEPLNVGDWSIL